MCSDREALRAALLCTACAVACGVGSGDPAEAPTVSEIEPACGDSSAETPVAVRGFLPVKPVVSVSDPSKDEIDSTYLAWLGDVALTDVTWTSTGALTAVVPSGIAVGTYGLTVEGPSGTSNTLEAAFEVRDGRCPVLTAALTITSAVAAPATAVVGQAVTVTATVQNDGQAAASGVTAVVSSAPSGLTLATSPAGAQDIPAGQARSFEWTYTATSPCTGVFVIDAAGTAADTGLAAAAVEVSSNDVIVNAAAFLSANAEVSATQVTVGQLITVALSVTNAATTAVVATPALAVTGPVTAGNAPQAHRIPAGSTYPFQWTFNASAAGVASFTASVSGTDPSTRKLATVSTAPLSVTVQGAPALVATLAIPSAFELGDFTVTMAVSNSGAAGAASVESVVPDTPTLIAGSTAVATWKSGPTGSPATVIAGQPAVSFTWVFTATTSGTLSLTSTARGTDHNTGLAVASNAAASSTASVGLHPVGGTISGLTSSGLVLHNGSDSLPVAAGATSFTFPTSVGTDRGYAVTVATQPTSIPSQTCTVANGSGTMGAAPVTNVAVTCTDAFSIGGTISWSPFSFGSSVTLSDNGGDALTLNYGDSGFTFPTKLASGTAYSVTAAPSSSSLSCTVNDGDGDGVGTVTDADVSIAVDCTYFLFR